MKNLIYDPKPKATTDELMQVLKVFTVPSMPNASNTFLLQVYESLPEKAKRHFKIIETGDR